MATPGTPTGRPVRARRCVSSKRELFPALQKSPPQLQPSVETWTEEENKALVEFVLETRPSGHLTARRVDFG